MKSRKVAVVVFLTAIAVATAWLLLPTTRSSLITPKMAVSQVNATSRDSTRIVLPPKSMVVKVPVAPPVISGDAAPSPPARSGASGSPKVPLHQNSLPFRLLPDDPNADAAARGFLHALILRSKSHPPRIDFDEASLTLDTPLALYYLSYEKLLQSKQVESAVTLAGTCYVVRTTTGEVTPILLTVITKSGNASATVGPRGAQIAQALDDLASQPEAWRGVFYEARLLTDDSGVRNFIWLKADDGNSDLFFEQSTWWIGTKRLYVDEQDFIKTYLAKIAELRAQEQAVP